jgi:hypothetical protein
MSPNSRQQSRTSADNANGLEETPLLKASPDAEELQAAGHEKLRNGCQQ